MLPAHVTTIARMPVNSHGQVDRQALLALAGSRNGTKCGTPPQGEVERQIAEVWEEILRVRPILREDNFYAVGGTSLLAIAISQRLHAQGYAVSPQTILVSKTIASLAGHIALASEVAPLPDRQQDAATAGQEDFWIAWKLGLGGTGAQITRILEVRGTVPEPARWHSAWTQLVAHHAALRTAFFSGADDQVLWRTVDAEELAPSISFSVDYCDSLHDAQERIAARSSAPFLLTESPLARAGLVQVVEGGGEWLFWFTLHHSVADGLSARIVQEEMHALLLDGALPPAPNGIARAS
jgi:hypothetical protein